MLLYIINIETRKALHCTIHFQQIHLEQSHKVYSNAFKNLPYPNPILTSPNKQGSGYHVIFHWANAAEHPCPGAKRWLTHHWAT